MVSRVRLVQIFLICMADVLIQDEHPSSTVMFFSPRKVQIRRILQYGQNLFGLTRSIGQFKFVHTWLGAFPGGIYAKSTRLMGNGNHILDLARKMTREQIQALAIANPTYTVVDSGITGIPAAVKASQEYPQGFADATIDGWERHRAPISTPLLANPNHSLDHLCSTDNLTDLWGDANLKVITDYLGVPHDRLVV